CSAERHPSASGPRRGGRPSAHSQGSARRGSSISGPRRSARGADRRSARGPTTRRSPAQLQDDRGLKPADGAPDRPDVRFYGGAGTRQPSRALASPNLFRKETNVSSTVRYGSDLRPGGALVRHSRPRRFLGGGVSAMPARRAGTGEDRGGAQRPAEARQGQHRRGAGSGDALRDRLDPGHGALQGGRARRTRHRRADTVGAAAAPPPPPHPPPAPGQRRPSGPPPPPSLSRRNAPFWAASSSSIPGRGAGGR